MPAAYPQPALKPPINKKSKLYPPQNATTVFNWGIASDYKKPHRLQLRTYLKQERITLWRWNSNLFQLRRKFTLQVETGYSRIQPAKKHLRIMATSTHCGTNHFLQSDTTRKKEPTFIISLDMYLCHECQLNPRFTPQGQELDSWKNLIDQQIVKWWNQRRQLLKVAGLVRVLLLIGGTELSTWSCTESLLKDFLSEEPGTLFKSLDSEIRISFGSPQSH